MILALDVGNTNTVVGGFEGETLRFSLRMQSDRNKTSGRICPPAPGTSEGQGGGPSRG